MLGLLVTEWSRLFRLRPAPGQHGAVITVGLFVFLESVLHQDVVARYGPGFLALLDAASARLATNVQRALDAQVEPDGPNPWRVAGRWLRPHGLISEGGVGR